MTKIIFIGATGTDIGKTYVTCMLIRQLREQGYRVRALKPVISGFDENAIETSDSGQLLLAMGRPACLENVRQISPWRYADPLPPHLAAAQTGATIILDELTAFCLDQVEDDLDFLLIEGAGGIMTPLNYQNTMLDLIKSLNCQCLLVAGSTLGTLSHTLTAITCIKLYGIHINGVIISESLENYIQFDAILDDFTKMLPDIFIKSLRRNNTEEKLFPLVI